jgi:hypothetical protein
MTTRPTSEIAANAMYFEDLSPALQAEHYARRKAEIAAISRMSFPFPAQFGGESVTVLGPVARFAPYKEASGGREDPFQLMVQPATKKRFLTFATQLTVCGRPLVSSILPLRKRPDLFGRVHQPEGSKLRAKTLGIRP